MENGQLNGSTTENVGVSETENGKLNVSTTGLTAHEQQSFRSFIEQCRDGGLLERPTGLSAEDALDGLNDEITLLRFLCARSFDVSGALQQFKDAHAIRSSVNSTEAYNSIDIADFEHLRGMYPHWSGQRTKHGRPICTLDVANPRIMSIGISALLTYSQTTLKLVKTDLPILTVEGPNFASYHSYTPAQVTCRAITSLDYLTRFVLPLCSIMADRPDPHLPVSNAVYLVDIASLSLRQAWNIRGYAQSVTGLLATCYPEVVDKIYLLNAPSSFSKIWAFVKGWVDPKTAAKMVIVSSADIMATLLETIDIECIPERYGGKSTAESGKVPSIDGLNGLLGVEELPDGPIKWTVGQGNRAAVAVGAREGEVRRELLGPINIKAAL